MAYNVFPATYPQYYPNADQAPQRAEAVGNAQSGIIWVQGEAGAKSYLVAPNTTVQLWDSESQTIYLKSADASGMPSIKTLDYTVRAEKQPSLELPGDTHNFISREEFNGLKDEISALQAEINGLKPRQKKEEK